jgi:hypothetical protein
MPKSSNFLPSAQPSLLNSASCVFRWIESSGPGEVYNVLSGGRSLAAQANGQSAAQSTWSIPTKLIVTTPRGDLQVTMGDEARMVLPRSSFRMMITSPPSPQYRR